MDKWKEDKTATRVNKLLGNSVWSMSMSLTSVLLVFHSTLHRIVFLESAEQIMLVWNPYTVLNTGACVSHVSSF